MRVCALQRRHKTRLASQCQGQWVVSKTVALSKLLPPSPVTIQPGEKNDFALIVPPHPQAFGTELDPTSFTEVSATQTLKVIKVMTSVRTDESALNYRETP